MTDRDAELQAAADLRDCYARLCAAAVLGQRPADAEDWAERHLTAASEVGRLIDMQAGAE